MNELLEKEEINIENMIYEVRGKQVMLDSDLAKLYIVETKRINEAVKNNPLKFPERFSWILTNSELENLRSKISTSSFNEKHGGRRYTPRVFTEQGVAMLSTILKSKIATDVSIRIMDAFVSMRQYISTSLLSQKYINDLVLKDTKRIDLLEETFKGFKEKSNEIYFDGQIYDAYSKIVDIMSGAKKELIIIDAYADKIVLDMIKRLNIKVTIITKSNSLLTKQDIMRYNEQYNNLIIKYDNTFHDRYFILDNTIVYHCGSSINRIGYKTFSITLIGDNEVCDLLIKKVNKIL